VKLGWGRRPLAGLLGVLLMYAGGALSVPAVAAPAGVPTTGVQGTVQAWGVNDARVNVPAGLSDVTAIAAGYTHTLALRADGTVVAWGVNSAMECVVPAGLSGVVAIAAGYNESAAVKSDGTVVGWGNSTVPAGLSGVTALALGPSHGLALTSNGTVVAWGNGFFSPPNDPTAVPVGLSNVIDIAAGDSFSLALKSDGTVVAWGDDSSGQTNVPAGLSGVVAISASDSSSLALKSDGTVVAWGQLAAPAGLTDVVAVSGGYQHAVALKSDGTVVAWGNDSSGQGSVPTGLTHAVSVSAGGFHNVVLRDDRVAPSLTADTPPASGTVGVAYPGYAFTAAGNPAPTFGVSSGTLPAGLTLSAGGVLSGTPTATGTATFTVAATNGKAPDAVSPAITLTIAPPSAPPAGDGHLQVAGPTGSLISTARPGARITLTGTEFAPGSMVTFVVYSTPLTLGAATADTAGTAVLTVTLPAGLELGRHTLVAYGTVGQGGPRSLTAAITLARGPNGNAVLASTGTDLALPLSAGLTLLTVGSLILLATRGRGRRSGHELRPGS